MGQRSEQSSLHVSHPNVLNIFCPITQAKQVTRPDFVLPICVCSLQAQPCSHLSLLHVSLPSSGGELLGPLYEIDDDRHTSAARPQAFGDGEGAWVLLEKN